MIRHSITNRFNEFFIHFKKQFVMNNDEEHPIYPISFWSYHERVCKGVPRTSNVLKSWHMIFNSHFVRSHPNLAHFINTLAIIEQEKFIIMIHLKGGKTFEITGLDFKKEIELRTICLYYEEFEVENYLKLINKYTNSKNE